MPIIGSFSYGSASAIEYSTVEELLSQLPDNTDNIIVAQDIRDAVYTLWERTGDGLSASVYFQNENPTPVTVGGIPAGSTFPDPTDMQTMWNRLLYPYVAPSCSLGPNYQREYGDPDGLAINSITLNWSVTKNSEAITSITVVGQLVVPTGNSQTGSVTVTGTHSVAPGNIETNTFSMSVTDGTQTDTDNATITWMNRIYWGSIDLGNIDLTNNPQLIQTVSSMIDSDTILDLDGAGYQSGSQLSTTKNKEYTEIGISQRHLIFAWPSSVSGALTPTFIVGGFENSSFRRVKTSWVFTNQYGFTTNYEVWVSGTLIGAPISTLKIS